MSYVVTLFAGIGGGVAPTHQFQDTALALIALALAIGSLVGACVFGVLCRIASEGPAPANAAESRMSSPARNKLSQRRVVGPDRFAWMARDSNGALLLLDVRPGRPRSRLS